uniref:DUF6427 family protein n=1 Tax=Flavobacterium sp. TaxID=239 RepID=UPI004049636E
MIASVFSKTKPINYLLLGFFIVFSFILHVANQSDFVFSWLEIFKKAFFLGVILSSITLVNFISLKNNLTQNDNYAALLFFIFLLFFPEIFTNENILISNLFLLLALRRLISLKSMKSIQEKLFDASFWIFLAALFHFWSIFYIILVFISIVLHVSKDYRNWIIPFIALFSVTIIFFIVNEIYDKELMAILLNKTYVSFDFFYFQNIYQNIALALFTPIALLFFSSHIFTINHKSLNLQSSYKKVLFSFLLGIGIFVLSANKNNSYLAFSLAPLAIIGANFIEGLQIKWMKEVTLYLLLFLGIFLFIMQL